MKHIWRISLICAALLALAAVPVAAKEAAQGSGGVHIGPYVLSGDTVVRDDVVVFGGPAVIEEGALLDGDLTVFGPAEIREDARVEGQLAVFGTLDIAGSVQGDIFCAGAVTLQETAYIDGNLDAAGAVLQRDGAQVEGEITTAKEWDLPSILPDGFPDTWPIQPRVETSQPPLWWRWFTGMLRAVGGVVLMSLLALVLATVWLPQLERVGRTIEEVPLTAFGVGLLTLVAAGIVAGLLIITICLSLFGIVGLIVVGVGLLVGWVALGLIVGRRIIVGLKNQPAPNMVTAAVAGTALITLVIAVARIFGPLRGLLLFVLLPLVAGAVVLTRFGTRPYASRGAYTGVVTPPAAPGAPSRGVTSQAPVVDAIVTPAVVATGAVIDEPAAEVISGGEMPLPPAPEEPESLLDIPELFGEKTPPPADAGAAADIPSAPEPPQHDDQS